MELDDCVDKLMEEMQCRFVYCANSLLYNTYEDALNENPGMNIQQHQATMIKKDPGDYREFAVISYVTDPLKIKVDPNIYKNFKEASDKVCGIIMHEMRGVYGDANVYGLSQPVRAYEDNPSFLRQPENAALNSI